MPTHWTSFPPGSTRTRCPLGSLRAMLTQPSAMSPAPIMAMGHSAPQLPHQHPPGDHADATFPHAPPFQPTSHQPPPSLATPPGRLNMLQPRPRESRDGTAGVQPRPTDVLLRKTSLSVPVPADRCRCQRSRQNTSCPAKAAVDAKTVYMITAGLPAGALAGRNCHVSLSGPFGWAVWS